MEEKTSGQRGHWTASADRLLGAMIGLVRASDSGGDPGTGPAPPGRGTVGPADRPR